MLRLVSTETSASRRVAGPEVETVLVARAAQGDRDAAQQLLLAHVGRVRRLVTRLVGGGADVDDLVQTTCLEVLRSLARFRGDASFALWIDRVAAHVVFKYFRSNRRRRARIALAPDTDTAPSGHDTARQIEMRQAVARAREIVEALAPDRRIIFLLVAVDGRTVEEAAAMLDVSSSAAKSRYLRARRQVDRELSAKPELAELIGRAIAGEEADHG